MKKACIILIFILLAVPQIISAEAKHTKPEKPKSCIPHGLDKPLLPTNSSETITIVTIGNPSDSYYQQSNYFVKNVEYRDGTFYNLITHAVTIRQIDEFGTNTTVTVRQNELIHFINMTEVTAELAVDWKNNIMANEYFAASMNCKGSGISTLSEKEFLKLKKKIGI